MGALADQLGGKAPGELIKAKDWNDLITAVEGIQDSVAALSASVDEHVAALTGRAEALEARADAAAAEIAALRDALAPFRRVTLRTQRTRFALGELAEITAHVTALDGSPLDLSNAAARPFVDFVATWGQLRPVAGFQSLGGADDRTLSVRVDEQGEARVVLRAEHAVGFAEATELDVATALTTNIGATGQPVAAALLQAATPMEAKVNGAFQVLTLEYDRTDAVSMRNYIDSYYIKQPVQAIGLVPGITHQIWRDHRSTVLAFVKPDSDPTTADLGQGVSSIQITFRDWIGPWLTLDYLPSSVTLIESYQGRFAAKIVPDTANTIAGLKNEVIDILEGKGLVGKQRDYQAMQSAFAGLTVTNPPPFLPTVTKSLQNAVGLQSSIEAAQPGGAAGGAIAFEAFTDASTQADSRIGSATEALTGLVEQRLGEVEQSIRTELIQGQESFKAELLRENGPIMQVQRSLNDVSGKVAGLNEALDKKADITLLGRFVPGNF